MQKTLKSLVVILMLVVISALVMMLIKGDFKKTGKTMGAASPQVSFDTKKSEVKNTTEFDDGLGTPDAVTYGTLDEFGEGIQSVAEFYRDINQDGTPDKITRTHVATGNDHDYQDYKIELNINGVMVNITPTGFRTTHGADCALRLIKFGFKPEFNATIISRPFQDTWDTPSVASKYTYKFQQNKITNTNTSKAGTVCDVAELF